MMALTDHEKAFYLSVALACVADIKAQERGDTKLSVKRRKKLRALEGDLVKAADMYLPPNGFDAAAMEKAGKVAAEMDMMIRGLFS